ncbi:MAG: NgoMIV family type II restriction endonuclease [Thermodesulfobacteriota bacterium]
MSIEELRKDYHGEICKRILGSTSGVPNLADISSRTSKAIASALLKILKFPLCEAPPSRQTVQIVFTELTIDFLNRALALLSHLRPGERIFSASQVSSGITAFEQYEHLAALDAALNRHSDLAAGLGGDYIVRPDILIGRKPLADSEVNKQGEVLGKGEISRLTPLRKGNYENSRPILHATVWCQWNVQIERSRNTGSEILNLISNRKGKTPNIVCVTAEPMPTRLASLAMGTGDIDCVYHMALPELTAAVKEVGSEDQWDMLDTLTRGKRLRDISDLPFDLIS